MSVLLLFKGKKATTKGARTRQESEASLYRKLLVVLLLRFEFEFWIRTGPARYLFPDHELKVFPGQVRAGAPIVVPLCGLVCGRPASQFEFSIPFFLSPVAQMFIGIRTWSRLENGTIRRRRRPPQHSRIAAAAMRSMYTSRQTRYTSFELNTIRSSTSRLSIMHAWSMEVWCGVVWVAVAVAVAALRFRRVLERFKAAFRWRLFSTLEAEISEDQRL